MARLLKSSYNIDHQVESFFTGTQIEFEEDGNHFYCARGSTINKVSVDDGQVKAQIASENEDDIVIRFTVTSDESLLIVAYNSGLIMKYNLLNNMIEREFKNIHHAPISCLKTDSSNTLLATGSSDGTVKLWNLKNHYCSHNLKGVNGVISCIKFLKSSECDLLFCAGGDDIIHIFDINTSKKLAKLQQIHCSTITDMVISPDGSRLISIGRDKIAVIWNISRDETEFGEVLRTIPLYESVESAVIIELEVLEEILNSNIESGRIFFATIGEEGIIKIWDTKTGSKILIQNVDPLSKDRSPGAQCLQLCSRPKYNQLCAVSAERDIFIYTLPRLELKQQLQGHIDEILSACWFANNKFLAIACNSNDLKVMEVKTAKTQHLKGHQDIVLDVKVLPSDQWCIITSSKDCTLLVWKFDQYTMVPDIVYKATGHTHAIHSIGTLFSEMIFFSGGEDTTLKRWVLTKPKKEERKLPEVEFEELMVETLIANQTVKAHDDRIDAIAVSPNDQLVATGSRDKTAKIFSAEGLRILATLKGHRRGIHAVQFSPVDQVLVTAGDTTLKMWNLSEFTCVKTFQGHDCAVLNFSFLSTGLQIMSIGSDGNMKLWDCKTSECSKTIDAHDGNCWTLSKTEDDSLIVTGGQDEKLIIWKDTTQEEREEKLAKLATQSSQEQSFVNYIEKRKWRKALKMAIAMENQNKTLTVIREIILESNGKEDLVEILDNCSLEGLDFIIDCCVSWSAAAKNSAIAQLIINILIQRLDNEHLLTMPSFRSSMNLLHTLTEKSFNRYERLVQQATFVDFFFHSFKIQ